jgi:hypothetical protein
VIIDMSAILAILFQEADAPQYAQVIAVAEVCRMSAANYLEAALNVDHRGDGEASRQLDGFIERAQIQIEAVTFNSLIGARREVYRASQLVRNAKPAWYDEAPRRLDPQHPVRLPDEIYHFLLPDPGMANYNDKVARKLYPTDFERLKRWRKEFVKPLERHEIARLQQLSAPVDDLWQQHTVILARDREATEDPLPV